MLPRSLLPLLLLSLLALPAHAEGDQEFRRVRLTDGRELLGIVLESTATGMTLRVPQGTVLVGYDALSDMATIDMSAWMAQPAARIAVAPATVLDATGHSGRSDVDEWLIRAASVVPRADVIGPTAWADSLGDRAGELLGCGGAPRCLRALAQDLHVDYLLLPTLKPGRPNRLSLRGLVASSGGELGIAPVALVGDAADPDRTDVAASAEPVAQAVFRALAFSPDVDVDAAVAALFPPPAPHAQPPPDQHRPTGPKPPQRAVAAVLGFAPVPGLASAYLRDTPGFLVSLLGTLGAAAGTVYSVGTVARSPEAFWVPNILVPYAINVAFNEVAAAVGWRRLHATRPELGAVAPVVVPTPDGGVVFSLAGRF